MRYDVRQRNNSAGTGQLQQQRSVFSGRTKLIVIHWLQLYVDGEFPELGKK